MPKIISKKEAASVKAVYQDGTPVITIVKNSDSAPADSENLTKALSQLCNVLTEFKTPTITVESTMTQPKDYTKLLQQIEELLSALASKETKEPIFNFQANMPDPPKIPIVEWEFDIVRDDSGRMRSILASPILTR